MLQTIRLVAGLLGFELTTSQSWVSSHYDCLDCGDRHFLWCSVFLKKCQFTPLNEGIEREVNLVIMSDNN